MRNTTRQKEVLNTGKNHPVASVRFLLRKQTAFVKLEKERGTESVLKHRHCSYSLFGLLFDVNPIKLERVKTKLMELQQFISSIKTLSSLSHRLLHSVSPENLK